MKLLKSTWIVLLLSFSFHAFADSSLNEASIEKIIANIKDAAQTQDVNKLLKDLSPNIKILLDMPKEMGGNLDLNFGQYKEMLEQTWSIPGAEFTHNVKNIVIKISQDKQTALVTADVYESVFIKGKKLISSHTAENTYIAIENGRPMIVKISGKVNL